jgi:hypothetical protein
MASIRLAVWREQMRKLRTRTVSTKLTVDEFAIVEAACQEPNLSEWVRRTLLTAASAPSFDRLIVAELLATRAIVVTLHFSALNGEKLTADTLNRLIERADRDKFLKAQERLATAPDGGRR